MNHLGSDAINWLKLSVIRGFLESELVSLGNVLTAVSEGGRMLELQLTQLLDLLVD